MEYHDRAIDGWATVIVRDGWGHARIDTVAREAGLPIGAVVDSVPDRWDALRGLQARFDRAALIEAASDPGDTIRNRLFALLMARFDAAQAQRALVAEIARAALRDPGLAAFMATLVAASLRRIAEAAGVDSGGLAGPMRVAVLAALYARVARVWLTDETADLAPTMKVLDAALAQVERLARFSPRDLAGQFRTRLAAPPPADDLPAE